MSFQFRLQSVLNIRQHERDAHQQSVAMAKAACDARIDEEKKLSRERSLILDELRRLNDAGETWLTDQVIDRQRHALQLWQALTIAAHAVVLAKSHLEICVQQLTAANQSVKSLERLAERRFQDYQSNQSRQAAREFVDSLASDRRNT